MSAGTSKQMKSEMEAESWTEGLYQYGNYYAGIVEGSDLDKILELHKRDTITTFGTRSSRRVKKPKPLQCSNDNGDDNDVAYPQPVKEVNSHDHIARCYDWSCTVVNY